jgi:hypothetical protein
VGDATGHRLTGKARARLTRRPNPAGEDIAWLGVIPAVAILAAALVWLAPPLGEHLYPQSDYDFFSEWRGIVRPEPVEQTRFLIAVAIPLLLAGAVAGLGSRRPAEGRFDLPIIATQAAAFVFVVWAVTKQEVDYPSPGQVDYFDPLLLSVPNLIAGFVIGLALTIIVLRVAGPWSGTVGLFEWLRGRNLIAWGVALAVAAIWLLPALVTDATLAQAGSVPSSHVPSHFQDYLAVVNGRTPLVDFIPRYAALLPLPVAPLLLAFDLSVASFSVIECVLSLASLLCIYAAFVHVTRGRWTALALYVPFVAISLFPWSDSGPVREFNGNYYALFPNRYLGPFIVIWLCARWLRRGSPPLGIVFFAAGLVVLNNLEFGSAGLAALVAAIVLAADRGSMDWRRVRGQSAQAVLGLLGSLVLVSVVTWVRSGEIPDPGLLGYASRIFGREAYGLLPMPTWGLHWALYVTYAGALLAASVRFVRGTAERTLTGMLAFAGIFGLLTGGYFAGRSDPFGVMALFPVWGFALALLAWTTIPLLRDARFDRQRLRRVIIPAFAVFAGFGVAVSAVARVPPPWRQIERLSEGGPAILEYAASQQFVEDRTVAGESILLVGTPVDHRLAERAGVSNVLPVGAVDYLFSPREVDMALDRLQEEGGHKVFESVTRGVLVATGYRGPFRSLVPILRDRGFTVVAFDPTTRLREWNRSP